MAGNGTRGARMSIPTSHSADDPREEGRGARPPASVALGSDAPGNGAPHRSAELGASLRDPRGRPGLLRWGAANDQLGGQIEYGGERQRDHHGGGHDDRQTGRTPDLGE